MRTFDPTFHNTLANIPEVAASVGWNLEANGPMLFDDVARNPQSFLLHTGDSTELPALAMIFCWSAPGVFEAHTLSDPKRREHSVQDAKSLIYEMVTEHGAEMVWGQPSTANFRACKFFEKIGAERMGEGQHPVLGPVAYFGGHKQAWLAQHWNSAG